MTVTLALACVMLLATPAATVQLDDSRWTQSIPSERREALEARVNQFIKAERDCDWGRVYDLRVPSLVWSPTETRDDYTSRRERRAHACEDGVLQSWSVIERMTEPNGTIQQFSGWAIFKCGDRTWKQLTVITAEWTNGMWYVSMANANPVRV